MRNETRPEYSSYSVLGLDLAELSRLRVLCPILGVAQVHSIKISVLTF